MGFGGYGLRGLRLYNLVGSGSWNDLDAMLIVKPYTPLYRLSATSCPN